MKAKKKLAKIEKGRARATKIFQEVLGDSVVPVFRPDGVTADVVFCAQIGCPGCGDHAFGVAHLDAPNLAQTLPPVIYECVAKAILAGPKRRQIGFVREW